ncbi:hypothetical protein BC834DRAFT_975578 [Gloeopeniophorella convolvens]|nr:hypothetical protein BC834DRAFT_975578 [Gloeopeniophorella convolvens]
MSNSVTIRDLLRGFVDDEARETHEEEEEDEDKEDVLAEFIHDGEDIGDGTSPAPSPPSTPSRDPPPRPAVWRTLLIFLQPTADNPGLWAVPVKTGEELRALGIILDRFAHLPSFASVFVRPSIPGHLLVETNTVSEVHRLLSSITSVLKPVRPRLVPVPDRTEYLRPAPSRPEIHAGQWVRCIYGLYAGDVGLVRETRAGDTQAVVALLPRIRPPVPPGTGTRTKGRPDPRLWGYSELLSVFGERKVKHGPGAQGEEHIPYKFSRDTFECGLVLKVLSSEHLELAAALPDLLLPFFKHPGILHDPAFARALAQVTQATYQREDRVEVTSGEYTGAVGAITIALGGRASIAATLPGSHEEGSLRSTLTSCSRASDQVITSNPDSPIDRDCGGV